MTLWSIKRTSACAGGWELTRFLRRCRYARALIQEPCRLVLHYNRYTVKLCAGLPCAAKVY